MKFASICIAFAVIAGLCGFSGKAASEPSQAQIESGDLLFQSGKFAEAGEIYAQIVAQAIRTTMPLSSNWAASRCSPTGSTTGGGWSRAIALHPDDADAKVMLAEAFWRRDGFRKRRRR